MKVSAYADDIFVFVSHRMDILAVKKAVEKYEEVTGAKINFDKSESLRLDASRSGIPLPGCFRWSYGPIRTLGVCFGPGFLLERNWLGVEVHGGVVLRVHLPFDPIPLVRTSTA